MKTFKLLLLNIVAVLMMFAFSPVEAQSVVWNGQYYNNENLSGVPVYSHQDTGSIRHNWGSGSPASSVPADHFSARWTTNAYFASLAYRFQATADDGVRVIVDDQVIIDTFYSPQPSETLSADLNLSAGYHNVTLEFREVEGVAFMYFGWLPVSDVSQPAEPTQSPSPSYPVGSWEARYFTNASLSGYASAIQNEASPSHNWGYGSPLANIPSDNFSARWRTTATLATGTYEVSVKADDGVRVYLDNNLLIDEWHVAYGDTYTAQFSSTSASHTIMVEYYEAQGIAFLNFNLQQISTSPNPPPRDGTGSTWIAQYYSNATLSNLPVVTQTEDAPSHNWGSGSPMDIIQNNYFSARWTNIRNLPAGTYQLAVRADDGVRVYIDGALYINEWHVSAGNVTYTATPTLSAGQHTFTVEYYENTGVAFIDYEFSSADALPSPTAVAPTGAYAVVTTAHLNVREGPSIFYPEITRINEGETYPVLARNTDSSWVEIDIDGTRGWVSTRYTYENNLQSVAVLDLNRRPPNPAPTGASLTTTTNLNLRTGPSTAQSIIRVIPYGTLIEVNGRNASSTWYLVDYSGSTGWVSAAYTNLSSGVDINSIPIR